MFNCVSHWNLIDTNNFDINECFKEQFLLLIIFGFISTFGAFKICLLFSKKKTSFKNADLSLKIIFILVIFCTIYETALNIFYLITKTPMDKFIFLLSITILNFTFVWFICYFEITRDCSAPGFTFFWFFLLNFFRYCWILKGNLQFYISSKIKPNLTPIIINSISCAIFLFSVGLIGFINRKYPKSTFYKNNNKKSKNSSFYDLKNSENFENIEKNSEKIEKFEEKVGKFDLKFKEAWASIMSVLTVDWLTSLLYIGYKEEIKEENLYEMKVENKSEAILENFQKNCRKKTREKYSIFQFVKLLFKSFGREFYLAIFLKILNDVLLFANPIILGYIIDAISVNSQFYYWGYIFSAILGLLSLFRAFFFNQYFLYCFRVGMKVKIFLMNIVYEKSVSISSSDKQNQTTGEIVNLMAVDSTNFEELIPYLNIIWSAPLQVAIGIYVLYQTIGVSSFIGLAIMLICLAPGNTFLGRIIKNIQIKLMLEKDERIKITNEMLNSMKIIKFYAWENEFEKKISNIRNNELKLLRKKAYISSLVICIWNTTSIFVALGTFIFYSVVQKQALTAKIAFKTITTLGIIRFPLSMLPRVINNAISTYVSLKRYVKFLNSSDVVPLKFNEIENENSADKNAVIILDKIDMYWDNVGNHTAINSINFGKPIMFFKNELVFAIGKVGSGKSAFLWALLGELFQKSGNIKVEKDIAYVAQTSWIQNATIRDNILFGSKFDKELYKKVIKATCLKPDLKVIKGGEFAEIGERGINLSGGQKQRIAMARALYSNKKVYLIDDALSAVDPQVGQKIFNNSFLKLLKGKTTIFSTNSMQFLKHADKIITIEKGEIKKCTTYSELIKDKNFDLNQICSGHKTIPEQTAYSKSIAEKIQDEKSINISVSEFNNETQDLYTETSFYSLESYKEKQNQNILIEKENREVGKVKMSVYNTYIRSHGSLILIIAIFSFFVFRQASDYGLKKYLAIWSEDQNVNNTKMHIIIYGVISIASVIIIGINAFTHAYGHVNASKTVGENLLMSILRAPMSFFDTTPKGRITNRFSSDIQSIDVTIPMFVFHFLTCFVEVISIIIFISVSIPFILAAFVPLIIFYYFVQSFFIKPSRDIKRHTSILLSPIYSNFAETLEGIITIRAFSVKERFKKLNKILIDKWGKANYPSFMINRWLSLRLEITGVIIVTVTGSLVVGLRSTISPGVAGIVLSYSFNFISALNWMIRSLTMLESNIVSVERILEYTKIKEEAPLKIPENEPNPKWPFNGALKITNLKMKYRPELEEILKGVNCEIKSGEKIGIVGRTGAGKSSLFNCLFRINEASEGKIEIDGIDISKIGLHDLREKITIIPQDPVLFSGSLRFNLDPFNVCSEEEIWEALELCDLKDTIEFLGKNDEGLLFKVAESGSNFSAGEKQLICIARALLRKSKILLLDEATSSIDYATDQKIQRTIRKVFAKVTVLTIAHRVNTIMDSDRVIVMADGRVIEFESPKTLLKNQNSVFYSIVQEGLK